MDRRPSLERFVTAQQDCYADVLAELRAGRKRSHWMWFVFPQLRGLGASETATYYGLVDLDEAREYLGHPVLGARLCECAELLLAVEGESAAQILGGIDAMKLRSSATLFDVAGADGAGEGVFARLLERFFDGDADPRTLAMLGTGSE